MNKEELIAGRQAVDQVKEKLFAYMDAGIDAFILSGYPHISECESFGKKVLQNIEHSPLT